MILKILAIADLLAIISLLATNVLPQVLVIIMAIYLIIKGLAFIIMGGLFPSILDMLSGLYLVLAVFGMSHWVFSVVVVIFLGQKAVLSLF